MGVSKVEFGGETLVDLTNDTVKENNLLKGATAHGADGEPVEGGVTVASLTTSLAVTEEGVSALDGTVGKTLNDKGEQIAFYKNEEDGMWHFRDWNGADTGLPFSNTDFQNEAIILNNDFVSDSRSITINDALQYKVIFASFIYNTSGAYSISAIGADKVCEYGVNRYSIRFDNAVFFPTSDTVTLQAYGDFYVCGVR